jgi:hypothetical protein
MDGRKNNKGTKGNPGNKMGYHQYNFISEKVAKHSEQWWKEAVRMMTKGDKEEKKFAMSEFNKLQVKMVPTVVAGDDDKPLTVNFNELFSTPRKTSGDNQKQ